MIRKLSQISPTLAATSMWLALPRPMLAVDSNLCNDAAGLKVDGSGNCVPADGSKQLNGAHGFLSVITDLLIFLIGAISVIMIIVGGLRYVLSGGDSGATKGAKDTILYAVVGLIVALLAYAIVHFVIGKFA